MKEGDRIKITGGYDPDSLLQRIGELRGTVLTFVPEHRSKTPAAVVRLDSPIDAEGITGDILLMTLRYVGASWEGGGAPGSQTVGLYLCTGMPSGDRRECVALETHAIFEVIDIAEPNAAPNGGPAASVDNSNAPGGPPSVS